RTTANWRRRSSTAWRPPRASRLAMLRRSVVSDPNLRRPGALGEAFGLAGRLPRRTTTGAGSAFPAADLAPSPAPAPVENVEGGTAVEQPASTRAEPVSAAVVHTPAVEADETDVTFQVSVYVLPAVSRAIEEARRRTGRTNAE